MQATKTAGAKNPNESQPLSGEHPVPTGDFSHYEMTILDREKPAFLGIRVGSRWLIRVVCEHLEDWQVHPVPQQPAAGLLLYCPKSKHVEANLLMRVSTSLSLCVQSLWQTTCTMNSHDSTFLRPPTKQFVSPRKTSLGWRAHIFRNTCVLLHILIMMVVTPCYTPVMINHECHFLSIKQLSICDQNHSTRDVER